MMVRIRGITIFMACAWIFSMAAMAAAIEVPLEYVTQSNDNRTFIPGGGRGDEAKPEIPPGEWKLPEFTGAKQLYTIIELGGVKRLVVLEPSKEDGFYDKLLFDMDGDGDLAEEAWATASEFSTDYSNWEPFDLTIPVGGNNTPYRLAFQAYPMQIQDENGKLVIQRVQLICRTACAYKGTFELNAKTYRIMLGDGNGNGNFSDLAEPMDKAKMSEMNRDMPYQPLYIRADLFVLSDKEQLDYYDTCPMGKYLYLDGALYTVAVDIPAKKMTLEPTPEPLATVKLGQEATMVQLAAANATKDGVMAYGVTSKVLVPPGDYMVAMYQSVKKDKKGDTWRMGAMATNETPIWTAKAGETVKTVFGEPYSPAVFVYQWDKENFASGHSDGVRLNFTMMGKGKEAVNRLDRVAGSGDAIPMSATNNSRPKEPTYKIVTDDGEVVAQGQFEYG